MRLAATSRKRMPFERRKPSSGSCRGSAEPSARLDASGDLLQRHPLPEHRVDLHTPSVVTLVAQQMRQPDVVRSEVPSMRPEPWVRAAALRHEPGELPLLVQRGHCPGFAQS